MKTLRILWLLAFVFFAACSSSPNATDSNDDNKEVVKQESNTQKQFYPNGNIMIEIELIDGQRQGVSKKYYEDGTVNTSIEYKNDLRDGEAKFYYQGGELYRLTTYKGNMLNGPRQFFHRGGELKSEQSFKNDFPGTDLKEYSNLGKLRDEKYKLTASLKKARSGSVITASLNKNMDKAFFYIGELMDGKFMHEELRELTPMGDKVEAVLNPEEMEMLNLAVIVKIESRYKNGMVLFHAFN